MAADRDPIVERLALLGVLDEETQVVSSRVAARPTVLGTARAARPPSLPVARPGTAAGLLVEVSDGLDADLETLDDAAWRTPVLNGWTVQDVVAHLTAVHEVLVERLNGRDERPVTPGELDAATDDAIAAQRRSSPVETRRAWRVAVARLRHGLEVADTDVDWLGLPAPAQTAIVDRAFETWIHANDIRRATNRSWLDPSGEHIHVLCDLAVQLLPLALTVGHKPHDALVTVNLSGPGGGSWVMPLGAGAVTGVEFTLNAVARDLCMLMGDRLDPAEFAYSVRGHEYGNDIARDLVSVAPSFARP
jgi:uncharacterized protein (TIGR03083 family)